MPFEVLSRHLGEVVVLAAKAHEDNRGYFLEAYREDQFRELGLPGIFVQDNHSCSKKGVVRGLHAQWDPPMGRLMKVTRGTAFLVAVDLRLGSPTLGQWVGIEASATNRKQVSAPAVLRVDSARSLTTLKCNTSAPSYTTPRRKPPFAGMTQLWRLTGPSASRSLRRRIGTRRRCGSGWLHRTRSISGTPIPH